jgi:hypothetical protein
MTTPARVIANQQNCQKSTGPKTEQGKKRSSMNAVKHGMRAETVLLRTENTQAFQEHVDRWMNDWQPVSEAQRWFAERAAISAWRCNRCVREETERLNMRLNAALTAWDAKRKTYVDYWMAKLTSDPLKSIRMLQGVPEGVLRLIDVCKSLSQVLTTPELWIDAELHHEMIMNLFGLNETHQDLIGDKATWTDLGRLETCQVPFVHARGMVTLSRQLLMRNRPDLDEDPKKTAAIVDRPECAAALRSLLQQRIGELEIILPRVDDRSTERPKTCEMTALKPEADDALYQRYEATHVREVRANLNMLMKLGKSDALYCEEESQTEAATTVATPVPATPEPASAVKTEPLPNEAKPVSAEVGQLPNEAKPEGPLHPDSDQEVRILPMGGVANGSELIRLAS